MAQAWVPFLLWGKKMKCLGLVDRLKRVNGICRTMVHTPDSLGACRRCLCAMSRDWPLLWIFVSFEQVLCFPLQSSTPLRPGDSPLNAEDAGCIPSPVNPVLSTASLPHTGTSWLVSLQTLWSSASDPSLCSHWLLDTLVPKCVSLASLLRLAGMFEQVLTQTPSGCINP